MSIDLSEQFRELLNERLDDDREDSVVAYRFLTHPYDGLPTSMNWFDIREVDGAPRITYATRNSFDNAVKMGKVLAQGAYTPGGHRTGARVGSVAQKVTGVDNGRALDVFSNAVHAKLTDTPDIVIIEGDAIKARYSERNHCRCYNIGDLARSCMRYDVNQKSFGLYVDNAKLAAIICARCQGTRARALIWTDAEGKQYIDRIYGNPLSHELIAAWAKEQKMKPIWNCRPGVVTIPAPSKPYGAAPYLDSLMFWCRTCNALSNKGCDLTNHDLVYLRATDGVSHRGWWGRCERCGQAFRDNTRTCQNQRRCGGCKQYSCGPCPNGCITCVACGTVRTANVAACPNGCIKCAGCNTDNAGSWVSSSHGRCRGCGRQLTEEPPIQDVEWTKTAFGWRYMCPGCGTASRTSSRVPDKNQGLVRCREVHAGTELEGIGHCRSCHLSIRLVQPEVPDETPDTLDEAFQEWNVRLTRQWVERMERGEAPQ